MCHDLTISLVLVLCCVVEAMTTAAARADAAKIKKELEKLLKEPANRMCLSLTAHCHSLSCHLMHRS